MAYIPNIGFTDESSRNIADPVGGLGSLGNVDFSAYNNQIPGSASNTTTTAPGSGAANNAFATGTSPVPGADQAGTNLAFWQDPQSGMRNLLGALGVSTNVNNSFTNQLLELADGLKWMSLLQQGPSQGIESFMPSLNSWLTAGTNSGGGTGFGGYGNLGHLLNNLLSGGGGNPLIEGYVDQLRPEQIAQAFGSMVGAAGFGSIAPEMLSGLGGMLSQLLADFGATGQTGKSAGSQFSDSDLFLQYVQMHAPELLNYFNVGQLQNAFGNAAGTASSVLGAGQNLLGNIF